MRGLPFLLRGSGALFLVVLAGCGGRSTTLDPDSVPVAENEPSTGGSSGKSSGAGNAPGAGSTTGSGAAPTGSGSATAGTPGKGGTAGGGATGSGSGGSSPSGGASTGGAGPTIDPYLPACNDYCSVVSSGVCPSQFNSFQECNGACQQEVTQQTASCQKSAVALLACLTSAFRNNAGCAEIDQLFVGKCSQLATAYQACVDTGPEPGPKPPPVSTCSSSGNSGGGACSLNVKCDSGAYYTVSCYQANAEQSSCSCSSMSPDGSGSGSSFSLNESVNVACYDSIAVCGFPQPGLR